LNRLNPDPQKTQTTFDDNTIDTAKYTVVTFVPRNLFEQFRRGANFYFLCNLILTLILGNDSPIDPTTWIMSLMLIVSITMLKQGYEDYLRHQSDR
jgi:phospholipid-translocating ATPase